MRTKTLELLELQVPGLAPCTLGIDSSVVVILSGPSGSGKTRLLRAIADLDPHSGSAHLDSTAQDDVPAPQWRRRVAYLPAESAWWENTPAEHFHADESRLAALALQPQALTSPIGRLSSGEKQRLALLRVLANAPEALLLDEPTAALDPDNTRRVEALIDNYRKHTGCVVLWVSHDPAQIERLAARHLSLNDGAVCEVQP